MYKCKQKLSKALTWLVITAQILAIITSATVGAIQPTPQMAQEAAKQAGLGDWLTQRAGKVAAWAQPLWGFPKTAAAQTVPILQSFTSTPLMAPTPTAPLLPFAATMTLT